MKSVVIKFGLLSVAILTLLQISQYALFMRDWQKEIAVSIIAILLILLGFYLKGLFNTHKKSSIKTNRLEAIKVGLSAREMEILEEMAHGRSNREIAEQLFISESTVKTHVSNVLVKLNAKRRTEAIQIARQKNLISDLSTN